MTADRVCRVLAIDGGGVRGLVAALVLAELEKRSRTPVAEMFDLVAGTSTGAVLALGLLCPGPDGGPRWSAEQMVDVYEAGGSSIFRRTLRRDVRTLYGFLAPKYTSDEMVLQLRQRLGNARLSQALRPLLIPTYDLRTRSPHFFNSARTALPDDPPMWQVALAAAAAPSYFAPVQVPSGRGPARWLVDGGVVANNPAMCAYAEVRERWPAARAVVVSVGCGSLSIDYATPRLRRGGALVWARPAFDVTLDGQEEAVDHQARQVLPAADYFRFQAALPPECLHIDNGSLANLRRLTTSARELLGREGERMDAAVERLQQAAELPA